MGTYLYNAESPPISVPCPRGAPPPSCYSFLVSLSRVNLCKYKQTHIHIFLFLSSIYIKGSVPYTLPCTWLFPLHLPSGFSQSYTGGFFILCSARLFRRVDAIVYLAHPLLMAILVVSITSNAAVSNHAQMSLHTRGGLNTYVIASMTPSLYLFLCPCPLTLDFAASLAKEAQCLSSTLKSGLHPVTCLADLMHT